MPAKRELTMRQIEQMLRLAHDGVSAREIGRMLGAARSTIQDNRPHPEQSFRTCLGVLRLFKDFGPRHAETIAAEATARGAFTYKNIAAVIAARHDRHPPAPDTVVIDHPNLRGPGYFH